MGVVLFLVFSKLLEEPYVVIPYHIQFARVFSHSVACLSPLLVLSYVQKWVFMISLTVCTTICCQRLLLNPVL